MDVRVLLASLIISVSTFAIYARYFDILVPFIPGGSVRENSGLFFALPVVLLVSGQSLFATWVNHVAIGSSTPEKKDALRAYFVASIQILLFSLYYAMFPYYGPYTFVVYFMPGQSFFPGAYFVLVAWTLAIVLGSAVLIREIFGLRGDGRMGAVRSILMAAAVLALIMVTAS
jgi:hypothetical protein